ncbi:DUF2290 domain-containing protein [Vibrio fluvialis]|nr:DUF2290 domain-containing protein [Vibrio fluvialis]
MIIKDTNLIGAINEFIFAWQKKGLVHDSNGHSIYKKARGLNEVSWGNDGYILKDEKFSSISEYCNLVENGQYSVLLNDGALFQISYTLDRNKIVKHRLCWYPCPIQVDTADLDNNDITDLILEKMKDGELDSFRSRSPIRFDYAPDQAKKNHPSVHMHMSEESCRIPVRSPLCLKEFMTFIVLNFYDDLVKDTSLYQNLKTWDGIDTLTRDDRKKLHMNVFRMA